MYNTPELGRQVSQADSCGQSTCGSEAPASRQKKPKKPKKTGFVVETPVITLRHSTHKAEQSAAERALEAEAMMRAMHRQISELQHQVPSLRQHVLVSGVALELMPSATHRWFVCSQLGASQELAEQRQRRVETLERELSQAGERYSELMKNNAKRLTQIAALSHTVDSERNKNALMLDDLATQSKVYAKHNCNFSPHSSHGLARAADECTNDQFQRQRVFPGNQGSHCPSHPIAHNPHPRPLRACAGDALPARRTTHLTDSPPASGSHPREY